MYIELKGVNSMTNKNFVDMFAANAEITKKEAKRLLEAFENTLKEVVVDGKVKVADLTFSVKDVAARKGVNPQTGEEIEIPATKRLSVKVGKAFKEAIK